MKLEKDKNHSTLNRVAKITALALLIPPLVAKSIHDLYLMGLGEERYISYQKENNYAVPDVLKGYMRLNPYNTEIRDFGDDTKFYIDYTSKRVFAITCPSFANQYCLLREKPPTIKLGHLVFGSGVPIPEKFISFPFSYIEKSHPRVTKGM